MERDGAVENMQRETQGFAVETLGQHDGLRGTIREVFADERSRACAGVRFAGHLAFHVDHLWTILMKRGD